MGWYWLCSICTLGYYLKTAKIMPCAAYSNSSYEGAPDAIGALDIGINYFINGHNAKITAEYHTISKDYREGGLALGATGNLSQLRLQLHLFYNNNKYSILCRTKIYNCTGRKILGTYSFFSPYGFSFHMVAEYSLLTRLTISN